MSELLPCPCCGVGDGKLGQLKTASAGWYVQCDKCNTIVGDSRGKAETIKAWNKIDPDDPMFELSPERNSDGT